MDFFDILGQMAAAECPNCGATTSGYSDQCEACGASLGLETDDPSLNLRDGARSQAGLDKTAVHESKNLQRLKQAAAELHKGGSSADFVACVEEVLVMVNSALELYTSPYMQDRIARMEPGPAKIYQEMALVAKEMAASLQSLRTMNDIPGGLQRFEASLWKIDAIQDRIIARANDLAEAGEA
ncbi:MAG: hypothetical protein U0931_11610 [Vulcanimicrobiota bacterium]